MTLPQAGFTMPPFLTVPDVLALPASPPDAVVHYGDDPAQFAELRLPAGDGPHPVVVVVHGGCWLGEYDLGTTSGVADALRRAGCATWHVEYRRLGMAGGGWPGTFIDVGAGIDALREASGAHRLDLARVVVTGHSAGGHLATWAAARHRVPRDSDVWTPDPLDRRRRRQSRRNRGPAGASWPSRTRRAAVRW